MYLKTKAHLARQQGCGNENFSLKEEMAIVVSAKSLPGNMLHWRKRLWKSPIYAA